MQKASAIYVYKHYCDEDAYGEEEIKLFSERSDAVAYLKEAVEEAYGVPFEEVPDAVDLDDRDTLREDYVSIDDGDGAVSFWIIEKHTVN